MVSLNQTRRIYLSSAHHTSIEKARGRSFIVMGVFLFLFVIIGARVIDLSIIQSMSHQKENNYLLGEDIVSDNNTQQYRGDIVDRNGAILARSLKTVSVYADPEMIENPVSVSKSLLEIFPELSYGSILQKLQSKKRFVWIKRDITPEKQDQILLAGHPGLNFKEEMKRVYPKGYLSAHIAGTTGSEQQGLSGIEASFDSLLQDSEEALALTIDIRLQHALRKEMYDTMIKHEAIGAAGLVMDVNTGEILAMSSLPDFNPHHYNQAKNNEIFNKATLGVYELGSTFKIFSTAALLEKSHHNISAVFDVRKPIEIGRFKIRDFHAEERVLTTPEVFIHSSNIGSAMMGMEVGTQNLKNFYKDIGLTEAPNFELQEVGSPIIPSPWREINTLTASYGHGIAVSPLQLVSAVSSIVNGGFLVKPTLILSDKKQKIEENVRVVSDKTAHRMRQLLRLVVSEGTGSGAEVPGYLVGGKTGTAEKPGKGGYDRKRLISSFVGVFPINKPEYAVFVMIDEPKGIKETYDYATGGWVGAPTVKRIIENMISIFNLKPSDIGEGFEGSLMRYVKTKEDLKRERDIETH
jgi:cell division protein FtsI (penicillin-binding protein 3)